MLTSDQLDTLTDPIVALYRRYMDSVIRDIARRIGRLDFATSTAAWQMQRLIESGLVYKDAVKRIAALTGISEATLRAMFKQAGVTALRFDDAIYRRVGLDPLPLNLSPGMAQVLAAGLRKTQGVIRNLTMSTAVDAQHAFIEAADLGYMQVMTGAFDYISAIRHAVTGLAERGLETVTYPGRRDALDVAVRRAVLTGVAQTTGELQMQRADEMGCDLVATSAHGGARPTHQVWQGRVFSRSGKSDKYPDFVSSTGYGTPGGLCGINCRHSFYPFYEGISERAYQEADLELYANQRVTYNGQEMSLYDATQKQRAIERKIRYWKRQAGALEAAGLAHPAETAKVREWQSRMREFIKQTGLQRQPEREWVESRAESGDSSKGLPVVPSQPDGGAIQDVDGITMGAAPISEEGRIIDEIKKLDDPNRIVNIGTLPEPVVDHWQDIVTDQIILTGERRGHYLQEHKEMIDLEDYLPKVILQFTDVHINTSDPRMAIFYLELDDKHLLRVALWISDNPEKLNSVHSMRKARRSEYLKGIKAGRSIIKKPS